MKIGLLTYFWDENPGTLLQAYSLLNALKGMFPTARVELINYRHARYKMRWIRNYLKWGEFRNDIKRRLVYNDFKKRYLRKGKQSLVSDNYDKAIQFIASNKYDVIVVGSDTVWQLTSKKDRPSFPNVYWLSKELKCKKIAYAVSSNVTSPQNIAEENKSTMKALLKEFALIGVRDVMTFNLVNSVGAENHGTLRRVPDPTFLLDMPWTNIEKLLTKAGVRLDNPILGLNLPSNNPLYFEIVQYFKSKKFQILSLAESPYADFVFPSLGPFEWAGLFKYMNFVITDRFHGCIFALKHRVPVLAVDCSPYRFDQLGNSKTSCLMEDFEISETNHLNIAQINYEPQMFFDKAEQALQSFDEKSIQVKLDEFRTNSLAYLESIKQVCSH